MSEHHEQAALINWALIHENQIPDLKMLYANPNGGHRHIKVAQKLKAEGTKPGVFDLALDVPIEPYHGLRIEMKHGKNKLTPNQRKWKRRYERYGYKAVVCYGWTRARDEILSYLDIEL